MSPATICNELAALRSWGLALTHPHTSAGRPDRTGRFFVRHLLAEPALLPVEQEVIRSQFLRGAAGGRPVAAHQHFSAARASAMGLRWPMRRSMRRRFKHMELVHIHSTKVLLVLVSKRRVGQQLLDINEEIDQGELSRISNELNAHLQGCDASTITAQPLPDFASFAPDSSVVMDAMQRMDDIGSSGPGFSAMACRRAVPAGASPEGENVRQDCGKAEQA
ncbi:MAG: hypothetical protein U0X20_09455 [Caldilineaceae bacterium]